MSSRSVSISRDIISEGLEKFGAVPIMSLLPWKTNQPMLTLKVTSSSASHPENAILLMILIPPPKDADLSSVQN